MRYDPDFPELFVRANARAAMRDPGASARSLFLSVSYSCRQVLAHPMMGVLSLTDPVMWQSIRDHVRRHRARKAWDRVVEPLSKRDKQRLVLRAFRQTIGHMGKTERGPDEGERMAQMFEAVVEKQINAQELLMALSAYARPAKIETIHPMPATPEQRASQAHAMLLHMALGLTMLVVVGRREAPGLAQLCGAGCETVAAISALMTLIHDPKGEGTWGINQAPTLEWGIAEARQMKQRRRAVLRDRSRRV